MIQGQTDVLTAVNGAQAGMTYAGGPGGSAALVFHDDPYLGGTAGLPAGTTAGQLPNGGTGSRVVYAGFGLEGLSNDYYSSASPNPSAGAINPPNPLPLNEIIPDVIPRNVRAAVLHNIVSYLRSGRVSGTITQTSGTGQGGGLGIDGVTVYLRPTGAAPSTRLAFSALTANGGRFTIAGVEPGTYTLVAVKPGFQRAVSNSGVSFTVEGDVTKTNATLTMTPQQPGNIAGAVHDTAGNLISGSTVTFTSQDNSVTQSVTSQNGSVTGNAAENYFLQTVPVTTYTATASSPLNPATPDHPQGLPEYTAATKPDAPASGSPAGTPDYSQGVTVQPNTTVQPVNFTLTPILATISGTVTSGTATGPAVAGATVTLQDSTGATVGTPVTTAADGTYTLPNIPAAQTPTTYTIVVTAPGFAPSTPLTETVYLGSVLTGQNVSLAPIAPGSILATVSYAPGGVVTGPVAGAIVSFTAPGATTAQTATTGADGTVVIPNVPPAVYSVVGGRPEQCQWAGDDFDGPGPERHSHVRSAGHGSVCRHADCAELLRHGLVGGDQHVCFSRAGECDNHRHRHQHRDRRGHYADYDQDRPGRLVHDRSACAGNVHADGLAGRVRAHGDWADDGAAWRRADGSELHAGGGRAGQHHRHRLR